jgi:hypothetical protein
MTTYTLSTEDRDEAMLHMQAPRMSLMMWQWEQLMRSSYKWESGRFHDALEKLDPTEALRELWYELKKEYGVTEEVQ